MKSTFALFVAAVMSVAACQERRQVVVEVPSMVDEVAIDSALYGHCGPNTAMSTLELIAVSGDSLTFFTSDAASRGLVIGGLYCGDSLTVMARPGRDGFLVAQKVVNLTSLMGRWGNLRGNFEILPGGVVGSKPGEHKRYTAWKMFNARLILEPDTFDILSIGPDSMRLKGAGGDIGYRRLPN